MYVCVTAGMVVCYSLTLRLWSTGDTTGTRPSMTPLPSTQVRHTHTLLLATHTLLQNQAFNTVCVCVADTNTWTELVHPQLSVPRAGHSIITMALANQNLSFKDDGKERNSDRTPKTLLVFGGGDNEGNFYSDLTTLVVAELLDQN